MFYQMTLARAGAWNALFSNVAQIFLGNRKTLTLSRQCERAAPKFAKLACHVTITVRNMCTKYMMSVCLKFDVMDKNNCARFGFRIPDLLKISQNILC